MGTVLHCVGDYGGGRAVSAGFPGGRQYGETVLSGRPLLPVLPGKKRRLHRSYPGYHLLLRPVLQQVSRILLQ